MTRRTTSRTVTFRRPFCVGGMENLPAGSYTVETEEELVPDVSFPAYRRTATFLFLPAQARGTRSSQMATIDPAELALAEEKDAR